MDEGRETSGHWHNRALCAHDLRPKFRRDDDTRETGWIAGPNSDFSPKGQLDANARLHYSSLKHVGDTYQKLAAMDTGEDPCGGADVDQPSQPFTPDGSPSAAVETQGLAARLSTTLFQATRRSGPPRDAIAIREDVHECDAEAGRQRTRKRRPAHGTKQRRAKGPDHTVQGSSSEVYDGGSVSRRSSDSPNSRDELLAAESHLCDRATSEVDGTWSSRPGGLQRQIDCATSNEGEATWEHLRDDRTVASAIVGGVTELGWHAVEGVVKIAVKAVVGSWMGMKVAASRTVRRWQVPRAKDATILPLVMRSGAPKHSSYLDDALEVLHIHSTVNNKTEHDALKSPVPRMLDQLFCGGRVLMPATLRLEDELVKAAGMSDRHGVSEQHGAEDSEVGLWVGDPTREMVELGSEHVSSPLLSKTGIVV